MSEVVHIGIPLYKGFDSLDVIGPYQVFSFTKGIKPHLIAEHNEVVSLEGVVIKPAYTFEQYKSLSDANRMDILMVPGTGLQQAQAVMEHDEVYTDFIRQMVEELKTKPQQHWPRITSVCAGSLLLAYAGALEGHTVTTHWEMRDALRDLKGITLASGYPRFVQSGNVMTAGGVSAGIDMALMLAGLISDYNTVCRTQLEMQYNPQPPFKSGDPTQVSPGFIDWPSVRQHAAPVNAILKERLG